jgi:hypothetical protein
MFLRRQEFLAHLSEVPTFMFGNKTIAYVALMSAGRNVT